MGDQFVGNISAEIAILGAGMEVEIPRGWHSLTRGWSRNDIDVISRRVRRRRNGWSFQPNGRTTTMSSTKNAKNSRSSAEASSRTCAWMGRLSCGQKVTVGNRLRTRVYPPSYSGESARYRTATESSCGVVTCWNNVRSKSSSWQARFFENTRTRVSTSQAAHPQMSWCQDTRSNLPVHASTKLQQAHNTRLHRLARTRKEQE